MSYRKNEEDEDRLFAAIESKEMKNSALYIVGIVAIVGIMGIMSIVVMMYYKLPV